MERNNALHTLDPKHQDQQFQERHKSKLNDY